ncbi:MAG: AlkA N-terminal domain-containing protein [Terracidiphilus sp.]
MNGGSVEELAARLGLGSRQLRRLFVQHLGVSPLKIATAHRVQLARKLINESGLPMTQIAFGSGFKSIRDFNYAILLSTGLSPTELRRGADGSQPMARPGGLELRLPYRNPFDWTSLIAFLKLRAIPWVELVTNNSYERTIEVAGIPGILTVTPDASRSRVIVRLQAANYEGLAQTVDRVRRIFDLSADPIQIARHLSSDPKLQALIKKRPGLRVPGVWDGFEAAVLAVLGQSLTSSGPIELVARFVQLFGAQLETPIRGLKYLFPRPAIIVHADLSKAGIDDDRANIIRNLASSSIGTNLSFAPFNALEQVLSELGRAFGIDESTASYIAMRALGEPDAFPLNESEFRRLNAGSKPGRISAELLVDTERWRPWRAYAVMHLTQ